MEGAEKLEQEEEAFTLVLSLHLIFALMLPQSYVRSGKPNDIRSRVAADVQLLDEFCPTSRRGSAFLGLHMYRALYTQREFHMETKFQAIGVVVV
jgi:hypothetical protein